MTQGVVRATQPPRPEWWDEGYEHDLNLGPNAVVGPLTPAQQEYWARIEALRFESTTHLEPELPPADRALVAAHADELQRLAGNTASPRCVSPLRAGLLVTSPMTATCSTLSISMSRPGASRRSGEPLL
ncbi:MAG: hypothetical protein LC792_25490 [Actinobacteria bacterium]|nr:hypothetical protein [Actinomycetota bacterium]